MTRRSVLIVLGLVATTGAVARPLEPEACGRLKAEIAALDEKGVRVLLEKGPAAVKGTVSREQSSDLRAYFDKLGNFRFRCPQDTPLVVLKPEPVDDPSESAAAGAPIEAGSPGITLPPGVAAATVAPVVPSAPRKPAAQKPAAPKAAAPKTAATQPLVQAPVAKKPPPPKAAAPAEAAPPAAAKPAAKPKPKVEDAFKPPADAPKAP